MEVRRRTKKLVVVDLFRHLYLKNGWESVAQSWCTGILISKYYIHRSVHEIWRMAMEDPHLMRLGHYLEHLEGAGEDGIDMEELEREFLKEPWKAGLTIVRVVDPSGSVKPFIEVVNIKEKDHQHCPFAVYTKLCQEGFEESEAEEDNHVLGVVGLAMDEEDVALPKMKQWEEREKCGELKGMFCTVVCVRESTKPILCIK